MATRHPLFMVREGSLVRPDGPRSWRVVTKSTEEAVKQIAAGGREAPAPYVYDVDGVEAKAAQFQLYQRLEQAHAVPWIHSGCRTPEDAMDTFFAGAEALTVDLRHMNESRIEELVSLAEGELHLGVRLGADMPRPRELARLVQDHGLTGVVLESDGLYDLRRLESVAADLRTLRTPSTLLQVEPQTLPASLEAALDRVVAFPQGAR